MDSISREEDGRKLALYRSYIAAVINSVNSRQYRELYVVCNQTEVEIDVINDGDLACAYFVSSLLHKFNLIKGGVHTTVVETEMDLLLSGWKKTDYPSPGAVVIWGQKMGDDGVAHKHIGVCISITECVCNCPESKSPQKFGIHDLINHDGQPRLVESFYVHEKLLSSQN